MPEWGKRPLRVWPCTIPPPSRPRQEGMASSAGCDGAEVAMSVDRSETPTAGGRKGPAQAVGPDAAAASSAAEKKSPRPPMASVGRGAWASPCMHGMRVAWRHEGDGRARTAAAIWLGSDCSVPRHATSCHVMRMRACVCDCLLGAEFHQMDSLAHSMGVSSQQGFDFFVVPVVPPHLNTHKGSAALRAAPLWERCSAFVPQNVLTDSGSWRCVCIGMAGHGVGDGVEGPSWRAPARNGSGSPLHTGAIGVRCGHRAPCRIRPTDWFPCRGVHLHPYLSCVPCLPACVRGGAQPVHGGDGERAPRPGRRGPGRAQGLGKGRTRHTSLSCPFLTLRHVHLPQLAASLWRGLRGGCVLAEIGVGEDPFASPARPLARAACTAVTHALAVT